MACSDGADSVKIPQLSASEEAKKKKSCDGAKSHHQPLKFTQTALETKEVWTPPEQKGRETSNCKYFFVTLTSAVSSLQVWRCCVAVVAC